MKLVLLPGMDGTGDLFNPLIEALPPTIDPVVVRYPPDKPLGYTRLEELARQSLPDDEPYLLLGESFSGPIAISIAASSPAQLRGLILACTFASCPRPRLAAFAPLTTWFPIPKLPAFVTKQIVLGATSEPNLEALLKDSVNKVTADVFRMRLNEAINIDVTDQLSTITVPTMYLRSAQDRLIPRSAGDEIIRVLPTVKLVEIETPHCLLQVAATQAVDAIEEFLRTFTNDH